MKWYDQQSRETFLRSARRHPRAKYTLHVEAVHLSKTGHLCPGYRVMDELINEGQIKVLDNGLVEILK